MGTEKCIVRLEICLGRTMGQIYFKRNNLFLLTNVQSRGEVRYNCLIFISQVQCRQDKLIIFLFDKIVKYTLKVSFDKPIAKLVLLNSLQV